MFCVCVSAIQTRTTGARSPRLLSQARDIVRGADYKWCRLEFDFGQLDPEIQLIDTESCCVQK